MLIIVSQFLMQIYHYSNDFFYIKRVKCVYMKVLMKHLSLARMHTLRSSIITQHNFRLIVPNTTWNCVHSHLWRQWIKVIWSPNNITLSKERKKKEREKKWAWDRQTASFLSLFFLYEYTDGHSHILMHRLKVSYRHIQYRKWWCFNQYLSHCWLTWSSFLFFSADKETEKKDMQSSEKRLNDVSWRSCNRLD
jgi:hypothetical protein